MRIFIPSDVTADINNRRLFYLVRPFYTKSGWVQDYQSFEKWGLDKQNIKLVEKIKNADVLLIPYPIEYYFDNCLIENLIRYNNLCEKYNIRGFGFISGDYGINYKKLNNITYFRMGGFRSQLGSNNIGFPAALSDQHKKIYGNDKISIRFKKPKPVIGFCGHATSNRITYTHQFINYFIANAGRLINNYKRKDIEPFFQSAYERFKVLKSLEFEKDIETNFIYRKKYRGGFIDDFSRQRTTYEYYNNIKNSDYIICIRGTGNYSIRLYETLMMGRIPIFLNTDCILPFRNHIKWDNHIIHIEWNKRSRISKIVKIFHDNISAEDFEKMQFNNRLLWKDKFQPNWILKNILTL